MGTKSTMRRSACMVATVASVSAALLGNASSAIATSHDVAEVAFEVSKVDVGAGMWLRHMVIRPSSPKGAVLFLHGFPETMFAWREIATTLGREFEVHAFDWPGFGESSRPPVERFAYAPRDYATILTRYIDKTGIGGSRLVIYATDIGALPALLAAVDRPDIARMIVVGDFAPFDRPQYMQERLQALKDPASAETVRKTFNASRDEILKNAFTRGLPEGQRYALDARYQADMAHGWQNGHLSSADAFAHYYAHFTRDQHALEAQLPKLKTPVRLVWGEQDIYINKEMGVEFSHRTAAPLRLLPATGHYPHLQRPDETVDEVRAAFLP
ncbi:alpha/beta fold hydrolase [Cupriavidus agavae]|uniref:Pimeloyl-ACP methyl ester carboxylesterase n=1 Tax=Cupriavidus agavae TaxID=1001822 RepID=A0A4Q7RT50_9BURK|nr:alpha/beta hydrolase [Cupriavidus agavae]RZT36835.1 pimeloyl-ACP methyl ester carboxylesterase [Cupriavidus agavae]